MSLYSRLHPMAGETVIRCDHCGGAFLSDDLRTLRANGWHIIPAWVVRTIDRGAPIRATKELPRG